MGMRTAHQPAVKQIGAKRNIIYKNSAAGNLIDCICAADALPYYS